MKILILVLTLSLLSCAAETTEDSMIYIHAEPDLEVATLRAIDIWNGDVREDIWKDEVILNGNFRATRTLIHEIGHDIGFDHSHDKNNVMYEKHNPFVIIPTEEQIKKLRKTIQFTKDINKADITIAWELLDEEVGKYYYDVRIITLNSNLNWYLPIRY